MRRRHLLTPEEAAAHLGITPEELHAHHLNGTGPDYCEATKKTIRYVAEDLDAWNTTTNH